MAFDFVFVSTDDLGKMVCEALGLEADRVVRIIIDIDYRHVGPVPVYVQMCATDTVLEIDWEATLKGANIINWVPKTHDHEP